MQHITAKEGDQFEACGLVEVVALDNRRVVLLGTSQAEESEECLRRAAERLRKKIDRSRRSRHTRG